MTHSGSPEPSAPSAVESDGDTLPLPPEVGGAAQHGDWEPREGRRFGPYLLLEEVGRGGMGIVFRARQIALSREVALKVLPTRAHRSLRGRTRFRREVELAGKLRHPGIVSVFETGEVRGHIYYSMPFITGQSLARQLQDGPSEPRGAARLLEKVAGAVDYAHTIGVVHRDLKPANILIDDYGEPLITDFGLAKDLATSEDLTGAGEVVGTPAYMAPEQAQGASNTDHRVDVYALGAILYELLTGRPVFQGESPQAILLKVMGVKPRAIREDRSDVPRDLETICLKALDKDRAFRYQSAGALAADLRAFLKGRAIAARPPGWIEGGWRLAARYRVRSFLVLAVALCVGAAVALTWERAYFVEARKLVKASRAKLYEADLEADPRRARRLLRDAIRVAELAHELQPDERRTRNTLAVACLNQARLEERLGVEREASDHYYRAFLLTGDRNAELAWQRLRGEVEVRFSAPRPLALRLRLWDLESGRPAGPDLAVTAPARIELAVGSYRITVREGERSYRFPAVIRRGGPARVDVEPPPRLPPDMVYVPAAELVRSDPESGRSQRVALSGFAIDRGEVTVAQYAAYLADRGSAAREPEAWGRQRRRRDRPVVGVSLREAEAFAAWAGKRLPLEEEWELAAGGVDGRPYPWGRAFNLGRANFSRTPAPAGSFPGDISPYGCVDMAGNVDEWVARPDPSAASAVLRGGFWLLARREAGRIRERRRARADDRFADTGFRCALDLGGPQRLRARATPVPAPPRASGPPRVLKVAAWPGEVVDEDLRRFEAAQRRAGLAVRAERAELSSAEGALALARSGAADVLAISGDLAPELIALGLVLPLADELSDPSAEAEASAAMFPAFARPDFLVSAGRCYGRVFGFRRAGLASAGGWEALWSPQNRGRSAIWDDPVWAVSLAALSLGLDPSQDLGEGPMDCVEERLRALLDQGCRLYRSAEERARLLSEGALCDGGGPLASAAGLTLPPGPGRVRIEAWMLTRRCLDEERFRLARAWVAFASGARASRDRYRRLGLIPSNPRGLRLLDKRRARAMIEEERLSDSAALHAVVQGAAAPKRAACQELWRRVKRARETREKGQEKGQ